MKRTNTKNEELCGLIIDDELFLVKDGALCELIMKHKMDAEQLAAVHMVSVQDLKEILENA